MPIHLIYARSWDFCIGRGGVLPWRLPEDFRHFQRTTMGHPVIMGRRTWADHDGALPGRTNVVLTRDRGFEGPPGVLVRHELQSTIDEFIAGGRLAFVIGGSGIFSDAFSRASEVIETVVDTEVPDGETFVEAFDFSNWVSELLQTQEPDERHAVGFEVWRRKRV